MEEHQFEQYFLSEEIKEALTLLGYVQPTEIQRAVIPAALAGCDILGKSQTGTGKTAAFAIPICERVTWEGNIPQALVLEPTRELAVQVRDELFYIGRRKRLKVPAVFGGFPIEKQIQTLRQKSHIVVGTPGRIMDHIRRGSISFQDVAFLVVDEADLMLDMGFLDEVQEILAHLPDNCQKMLFSATLGDCVRQLADDYLTDPVSIVQGEEQVAAADVVQVLYEVDAEEKYEAFVRILTRENAEAAMIFCGTREMANVLYRKLRRERIACGMIHGEIDQKDRLKTVEDFRIGRFSYLIATDVAARGIDFAHITHVFNYDFPTGRETFVHRAGRTGRNGKTGRAVSLVCEADRKMKRMVEDYIGLELELQECPVPTVGEEETFRRNQREKKVLRPRKGAALNQSIMRLAVGGGKKSKMRAGDIVGTICSVEGVESSDIGIIDVRDSLTYVEILNGKGQEVLAVLQEKPIKGKLRKVRITRNGRM